ncbi:SGNH/GDSL hydrolase family protein [Flexivirga sp. ID2601S]|uniref:SGNH/GDSL hydrolase family protein n=1 Tax=Flexivirga aerilata TaxID=1656889 RepID=A0A849AHJ4_9MICO|nr:SGNH/GDSL hydrolase family protein [Flexivirga aerilata]NNG39393.1 SGNH/GDSL hydrolase family protein [Flexivirga aerilata]
MSRALRVASALALAAASAGGAAAFAQAAAAAPSTGGYYLALGDSLAAGYQPGQGDDKTGGYVGDVLAHLQQTEPGLQLQNLACSGETTTTMLAGGKCSYPQGNQVDAAVAYLKAHPKVSLVTIDIGANNVQKCATTSNVDLPCVIKGLGEVSADMPKILGKLRAAVPNARIVVANYYNPFLAAWLTGTSGQALAKASVQLQGQLNGAIEGAAKGINAPVADVATAFSSTDFTTTKTVAPYGALPLNVARICEWTWMCAQKDIHANDLGYPVVAKAVIAAIPAAPSSPTPSSSGTSSSTATSTSSTTNTATSTATSTTTGPPIITDGGETGGSNDGLLVGAGVAAAGAAALAGGALVRTRRRRD